VSVKKVVTIVLILLSVFLFAESSLADSRVTRLGGKDRFAVAVNVSKEGWESSDKVVIANYLAFADALSATPLAFQENAPILLTHPDKLTETTEAEIKRLGAKHVTIVGGPPSVSSNVTKRLEQLGISWERIGGHDRYEVSYNVAKKLHKTDTAVVAYGLVFSDALSIAPYAAKNGFPILLTKTNELPPETVKALEENNFTKTVVSGGEPSVGKAVYSKLPSPTRMGGKDRYEVAANIANNLGFESNQVYIATGLTFADALTGSVLAAKQDAPMLLTRPSSLPEPIKKTMLTGKAEVATVLGGPPSVNEEVASTLFPLNNTHSIEGYSNKLSFFPGETIDLKVHSPEGAFSMDIIRYGNEEETILSVKDIQGKGQNYYGDAYKNGALWDTSYQLTIPENWSTGMYAAKVYDTHNHFYITFIVKEKSPENTDIGVLASTNTWQAYNSWGGKSLYTSQLINGTRKYNEIVNFNRPNPGADPTGNVGHLANGEKHILGWLERNNHAYSMIAEKDVHDNPALLRKFKTIIISTHSEYWSTNMYNSLESYLKNGGNVLYLSGNGIYWKVAFNGDQMEAKKDGGKHAFTGEQGGLFYQIGRPETALVGVGYRSTGFSVPAPYKVVNNSHWIFANTGIENGELIGTKGLNTTRDSSGAASGWETDQMDKHTPKNKVLLAQGTNKNSKGVNIGADMIYYDHPGGGGVFSAGSITFGGSLAIDEKLTKMVNNVLNNFEKR
jgi:putative cell wall-binding protein